MSLRVAVQTLGCKVNQYESSYFLEVLTNQGYREVPFSTPAEVYLVHGCGVTSKASHEACRLLRRAARTNPSALVVAAGCNAVLEGRRIAREGLATHILGNDDKYDLLRRLDEPASRDHPVVSVGDPRSIGSFRAVPVRCPPGGRARALLKAQDGCDAFCSYCIVPYTRGKSRSLPLEDVFAQAAVFVEEGFREVVLTGVHLGQWGRDLSPPRRFSQLLRRMDETVRPKRVRLSSLEVLEIRGEVLGEIRARSWICPHFHVPLQSGHPEILRRMNRKYTPREYGEILRELRSLFPRASLGADVMVGFPGETPRAFEETYELVRKLPLTYLHVFPYSPRPGTPASKLPGRVVGGELRDRARALRELGAHKKLAFMEEALGTWVEVMAETEIASGWYGGTSENYLHVNFPSSAPIPPGTLVRVKLTNLTPRGLVGRADSGKGPAP